MINFFLCNNLFSKSNPTLYVFFVNNDESIVQENPLKFKFPCFFITLVTSFLITTSVENIILLLSSSINTIFLELRLLTLIPSINAHPSIRMLLPTFIESIHALQSLLTHLFFISILISFASYTIVY